MIKYSLLAISVLLVSACESSTPVANVASLAAANAVSGNGVVTPEVALTAADISQIRGQITLFNTADSTGEINISIRGLGLSTSMLSNGEFELDIPMIETARTITLNITGEAVMQKSITVQVPARAEVVTVDADIAGLSPAITFNLDTGGVIENVLSPSRTSVSVPANAFQFEDGTNATGTAQVSITEIDIKNLDGDSSWAPNMVGLSEGSALPTGLISFGMSDFHFSQDGRPIQLRQGVNAAIKMDLVTPYLTVEGSVESVDASAGAVIPLWHFDTEDMIWKEEGEASVVADSESDTGFSASGEVSHFSTWNLDVWTPSLMASVVLELVDTNGEPRDDLELVSYLTTASIPLDDGPSWHLDATSWSNTVHMTPRENKILVLANLEARQSQIDRYTSITGFTTMDITVDNIVIAGHGRVDVEPMRTRKIFHDYDGDDTVVMQVMVRDIPRANGISESELSAATITNGLSSANSAGFGVGDVGDASNAGGAGGAGGAGAGGAGAGGVFAAENTIEIVLAGAAQETPIVQPLPTILGNVELVIIDFFGDARTDLTVERYRVTAQSDTTTWANQQDMTPESNKLLVQANNQARLDSDEIVTTQITLDSLQVRELGDVNMLFTVINNKVFTTFGSDEDNTVILEVAIADE